MEVYDDGSFEVVSGSVVRTSSSEQGADKEIDSV